MHVAVHAFTPHTSLALSHTLATLPPHSRWQGPEPQRTSLSAQAFTPSQKTEQS
jgi:hypothetical protein